MDLCAERLPGEPDLAGERLQYLSGDLEGWAELSNLRGPCLRSWGCLALQGMLQAQHACGCRGMSRACAERTHAGSELAGG